MPRDSLGSGGGSLGSITQPGYPMRAADSRARAGQTMTRERWMALCFLVGSACFFIGPFPGYAHLVGDTADAVTFFAGSILFTAGGAMQVWLSLAGRRSSAAGRTAFWAAAIQSAGTLFFNATTYRALHTAVSSSEYNKLVWRPDALGSVCFLVSGLLVYRISPRRGWWPRRGGQGWWEPAINLLGCVLFGIAAIAGYVVPSTGSVIDQAAANWTTALGAGCFGACAAFTLRSGRTAKTSPLVRLQRLEGSLERDAHGLIRRYRGL